MLHRSQKPNARTHMICDDSSEHTFTGAAPNDSPEACMKDVDGDDWGDDEVPEGVTPGSDCDDNGPDTFPGAAPNDSPEAVCHVASEEVDHPDRQGPDNGIGAPPRR